MSYDWLDAYLLDKPGVTRDYKPEWEATRYFVGGKMLLMAGGDGRGTPIYTMKLEPAFGQFLRAQYPCAIIPGYHMNKLHWNSLYLTGEVPDAIVRDMADDAYRAVLMSLPKRVREGIGEIAQ
ncbi:MAG: MmcQ/YjbR family DNA-binding protein [Christensenellaceae bacterium]|nr:MmcQ/YjbR family DNA-binding protein [Christensenellaceae bacterium]